MADDPIPYAEDVSAYAADVSASDITDLLGGPPANPPYGDSEPGKVAPHVTTFGMVLNTVARTYSYRYDEALRHLPSNALAMRRDCYLTSLLNERALPTARRKWQLEVDNDQDARQKLVKDGLTKSIKAIRHYTKFRFYLTKGALWYGRYGSQGLWTRKDLAGEALWTFDRHAPVNGDKIQFGWDGVPRVMIQALAAQSYPQGSVVYGDRAPLLKLERPDWRRQFIIHKHEVDDADYFEGEMAGGIHGIGLRSQIYWAWWLRDEMLGWAVDFMQKVGTMGLLIFWYAEGSKEGKTAAIENAKLASTRSVLVAPKPMGKDSQTWGVDQLSPSTGGIEALKAMIEDYFERHMERLIVGQSMSSGGRDTQSLGGSGRADLAADTKYQLLAFDADNLDESLTSDLIDVAKQLNYPWADFPVRHKSIVPDPEKENRLKGLTTIWDRLPVRTEDVYEAADAITPGDDDEVVGGGPQNPGGMPGDPDFGGGGDPPLGGVLGDGPLDDDTDGDGWDDSEPDVADDPADPFGIYSQYAWRPEDHPKGDDGKFIDAHHLHAARTDPAVASDLRARVTDPVERKKLDDAIQPAGGVKPPKKPAIPKKPNAKRLEREATKKANEYLRAAHEAAKAGDEQRARDLTAAVQGYHRAAERYEEGEFAKGDAVKRLAEEFVAGKRHIGQRAPVPLPQTYAADPERATDGRFGKVAGQHGGAKGDKPSGGNRPRNAKGHPLNRDSFREAIGDPERAAEIRAKLSPEEQAKFDQLILTAKGKAKEKRGAARESKAQSLADETAKTLQANTGALNRAGMYGVAEAVQRGLLTLQLAGTKEQALESVKDCEQRVNEAKKAWKDQDRKAIDVILDDDRFAGLSRSDQRAVRTAVSLELREMRANMPELELGDVRSAVRDDDRVSAIGYMQEAFDSAADPGVALARMDDALSDPDSVGLDEFGPSIDPDTDDIPRIQAKLRRAGIEPPADDGRDPWDYWDGPGGDAVQAKKDQVAKDILAAIRQHYGLPGRDDTPQAYAAVHAPAGGVLIGGQFFTGGEFIPGEVMAKASPVEKAKVGESAPASGGGEQEKPQDEKTLSPKEAAKALKKAEAMQRYYQPGSPGWAEQQAIIDRLTPKPSKAVASATPWSSPVWSESADFDGAWKRKLDGETKTSFVKYSHNSDAYNAKLRNGTGGASEELDQSIASSTLPADAVVYRGLTTDFLGGKKGGTFTDRAYVSTSKSRNVAENFMEGHGNNDGTGCLLEIKLPKGSKAAEMDGELSPSYGEDEVLLPRGSKFKITGVRVEKGVRIYEVSHVPG